MIVYSATRAEFTQDVFSNRLELKILAALGHRVRRREVRSSWQNSMQYMNNVLLDGNIAGDAGGCERIYRATHVRTRGFHSHGQGADDRVARGCRLASL